MRIEGLKGALVLIFVAVSLSVPLLALSKPSQATVFPNVDNIFVMGKDTAYSYNNNPPAPLKTYVTGDDPPIMMADQIGNGRVVASGDPHEARLSPASDNFVALTDAIFKWLKPGATNVLWFNGYGVYCTSSACSYLITKLQAKGYTITGSASTPINPAGYDILVLPEMNLGSGQTGGDPSLLPGQDVANIRNFVQGGGGLLIMCGSDYFGPSGGKGNFYKVMNKVLENLGFGYGGRLFGFQGDSVYDDVNHSTANNDVVTAGGDSFRPVVDVNINNPIGAAYQAATGRTDLRAYGNCSLVQLGKGMAVYAIPTFRVGMPGDTLTYRFSIFNTGVPIPGTENVDLTINLTITDNSGWGPTLDNSSITLPQDNSYYVVVRVTIPNGTPLSAEDTITVTATTGDIVQSLTCVAKAGQRLDPTDDAYVRSDQPDTNLGNNTNLEVGRFTGTSENTFYNSYLKFSLAGIPSNANITEARLYLYCYHAYGSPQGIVCKAVDDDSWNENSITYNNAPTPGATLDTQTISNGFDAQPVDYSWDVSSYIQSQYTGDQLASIEITRASETPESAYRWFDAKEWFDNTRPFLEISYTQPVLSLVPGWNLLGFSIENSPNNIFTGLSYYTDYVIYSWSAPGGPYNVQNPDTVFKDNVGYWVWINRNKTVSTSGIRPISENINLVPGWNLVRFPVVDNITTPNKIFAPLNYYENYVIYSWSAPGGPYNVQDSDTGFKDNVGYWVWIDQNKTVTVPDFSISVSPTSGTINRGGSTTATIIVTSINGHSSNVNLSTTSPLAGVTINLNPTHDTPTFTSTMTINAALSTASHTETIYIYGNPGGRVCSYTLTVVNRPPNTPGAPSGTTNGTMQPNTYQYTATTTDPDGDLMKFYFEWGDNTNSGWIPSGDNWAIAASAWHSWLFPGDYNVRVKAKDCYGAESGWSDNLNVRMDRLDEDGGPPEVGVWAIGDIPWGPVPEQVTNAQGFYDVLVGQGYTGRFTLYNQAKVNEVQFQDPTKANSNGKDYAYTDNCDFIYFADHGGPGTLYTGWTGFYPLGWPNYVDLTNSVRWGDVDMEWAFLHACDVLDSSVCLPNGGKLAGAFDSKLHGMCGFSTDAYSSAYQGEYFAEYATGLYDGTPHPIGDSWVWASKTCEPDNVWGAWLAGSTTDYTTQLADEYLPGFGSGMLPDPNYENSSGWCLLYYTWKCEWP